MSNVRKTWFLSPTWDIPPTALQLGYIITDPLDPRYPLNPVIPYTQSESETKSRSGSIAGASRVSTGGSEVFITNSPSFRLELTSGSTTSLGLWGRFLQVIGLDAEAKLKFEKDYVNKYAFESVHTEWFSPTPNFVKETVQSRDVQDYIDMAGTKKPLYMVCGTKIVTGAELETKHTKSHEIGAKFGVDGTSAGAPMSFGPEAEHEKREGVTVHCRRDEPFVFAYQLVKIQLKSDKARVAAFTRGAMFDAQNQVPSGDVDVEISDDVISTGYAVHREGSRKVEYQTVHTVDEGTEEDCASVVPVAAR